MPTPTPVNWATGRPVTISETPNSGYAGRPVDVIRTGDSDWAISGGSFLTFGARGNRYDMGRFLGFNSGTDITFTLDLGTARSGERLYVFGLVYIGLDIGRPLQVKLESSDNGTDWTTVEDLAALTGDATPNEQGFWIADLDISGAGSHRYWRLTLERDPTWLFVSSIEFWSAVPDYALGRPVTLSHAPSGSYPEARVDVIRSGEADWTTAAGSRLTDGHPGIMTFETNSYMGWVTLGGADVTAAIDLGTAQSPALVVARGVFDHSQSIARPLRVALESSDNGTDWTMVEDRDSLTAVGGSEVGRWVALFNTSGAGSHRYWRLTFGSDANDWFMVSEISLQPAMRRRQLEGSITTTPLGGAGLDNLRLDYLRGSAWQNSVGHLLIDDWKGGENPLAAGHGYALHEGAANDVETETLDLGTAHEGGQLIVAGWHNWGSNTGRPKAVKVESSDDGANWTLVDEITGLSAPGTGSGATPQWLYVADLDGAGTHRYWRVSLTQSAQFIALSEIDFIPAEGGEAGLVRSYVGTSSVGASSLAMTAAKMYVKQVTIPAGHLLASIEAHLRTTDGDGVTVRPVLYEDNAGAPGKLIGYMGNDHTGTGTVKFNGRDDWVSMPMGRYFDSDTLVWIGLMAPDIGTTALALSHETSGGDDQQINGFSATFVGEPGAIAGGSLTDPGSHLYSIRASLIAGWESHSRLGRSTIGGSWLAMTTAVYMKKITVPANSLIAGIAAHIKHTTANGSNLRAVLYSDNAGAPGLYLMNTPTGQGMFMSTTGRWLHFPIGKWNDVEQDYWIGIQMGGSNAFELAYDASGGGDGSKANHSDSGAWTAGDDDVSLYAEVLA